MKEQQLEINGVNITYVFKQGRLDTDHMIVVFSGYGGNSQFTYDFINLLSNARAHVLWIKDDFCGGTYANYYIDTLHQTDKKIEPAIVGLIDLQLNEVGLYRKKCTVAGASKGGAAAMYYGIKYDFLAVVASSPTLNFGSYLAGRGKENTEKSNARHMFEGDYQEQDIVFYDSYIRDAIHQDTQKSRNIYLITSQADRIYEDQIAPFLEDLKQYSNFNYIESQSILIKTHQDVAKHCAPLIQSILTQLSFNLISSFPDYPVGGYSEAELDRIYNEPIVLLQNIALNDEGKLCVEGVGIIQQIPCPDFHDIGYELFFESVFDQHKMYINISSDHKPDVTAMFVQNEFIHYDKLYNFVSPHRMNYDQGYFCTPDYKGIDVSAVPVGVYQLGIKIKTRLVAKEVLIDVTGVKSQQIGNMMQRIWIQDGKVFFEKLMDTATRHF